MRCLRTIIPVMARPPKQKITPRAMLELKMPGEVQVASDNDRIAYSISETDWDEGCVTSHIYVTTTADDAAPRQVTRGASGEASPHWSPDGKWLAFYTSRAHDELSPDDDLDPDDDPKQQMYLLPMDGMGGEAEKLTDAPEGVVAFDWLPDSSGVVYLAHEPRRKPHQAAFDEKIELKDDAVVEREERFRYQIWRIGHEDKKPKLLHAGDYGIGEIAVSPDGLLVAYVTNYTGEENDYHKSDLWLLTLETGQIRQLTDGPGGKFHPVWSQDSEMVYFTQPLDPVLSFSQENLYSAAISDGSVTHVTANFPHDVTGWRGVWFDSQNTLYLSAAIGTATVIFRQTGEGFEPLTLGDEHIHDFHVGPNGSIAYVASSSLDVPEVLWLAPNASEPLTLTDHNEDWQDKYALSPTEIVRWQSKDGLEIEGLLTLPANWTEGQPAPPLIVNLHGGPHGRTVQSLTPYSESPVYAAQGYAILSPNYRGSEGYGPEFCIASRGDFGGGDFQDVMAGVDWAIGDKVADPDRLAVMGASYGGFLTNWAVGHTDRFKAAVSKFGIWSLMTDFSNSLAPRWEQEYLGGFPWDRPGEYLRMSPAEAVKNIHTPILILHGEGDTNTFIANSQELYTALRLLGRTVEYAHYPREGHGFAEPQHRVDEFARCLAWLDRYVLGDVRHRIGHKITHDGWELTVAHAALQSYAGRGAEDGKRYVEIAFILRDTLESERTLTIGPSDVTLTRTAPSSGRSARPVGLPVDVLSQKVLAEGSGWRFQFAAPSADDAPGERGLAVPVAVTFRITNKGGTFAFAVKDFPPVIMDVPAAESKDDKKSKDAASR